MFRHYQILRDFGKTSDMRELGSGPISRACMDSGN